MKITKKKLTIVLMQALLGFVLWTIFLSPYVLLITKMTIDQYVTWLIMQLVLATPLSVVVIRITNYFTKKVQ